MDPSQLYHAPGSDRAGKLVLWVIVPPNQLPGRVEAARCLVDEDSDKEGGSTLVMCLTNDWCFVAPKMAWGEARRGSISARICDRGATKPQAIFGATLRAAVLLASRVVARSSQTHEGYARRSRLAGDQNPLRQNTSHL